MTIKRAIDVGGAGLLSVVMAPVMGAIAVAIVIESGRPVLFWQPRVGRDGRVFSMAKFRTMRRDAERGRAALLALSRDPDWLHVDDDPRVTRLGRILRRTSLDELPQLWNVLRGDMSLVGPRPLIPIEHERIPAWAHARDAVTPGITGLWQVSGRTAIPFGEMLLLDHRYAMTRSLRGDLDILVRTVPAVLTGRGAN